MDRKWGGMRQTCWLGLLIFLCLFSVCDAQAQQPVVYAVLFFSPSCGHCHYVITEFLPPLQDQYGDQLQVLFIDVSQSGGGALFYAACGALNVPDDHCGYVPTLVIGTTVLVGSQDIPEQMPALVRDGLAAGGVDIPAIPGLREAYDISVGGEGAGAAQDTTPESAPISTTFHETTWRDRLSQDRLGNSLAIGVLGVLIIGLAAQLGYGARLLIEDEKQHWTMGRAGWLFVLGLAVMTMIIAATLVRQNGRVSLPFLLAAGVTCGMALVVQMIMHVHRQAGQSGYTFPGWLLPVVACLGLVVAGYLTYVEIGENEAVCGAVGDCNTVQQSEYAELFGLVPIGLLGVCGYVMILAVWAVSRYAAGWVDDAAQATLLSAAVFGTVFSIYLTFLEPFVIGATCAWCLTSAMLMILILCLQAPAGWTAVNRLAGKLTRGSTQRSQPDW
jgi:thiol-disulfide isomerase/thioredoxin/heme/copper-type cytochrome/quinol oxidase subunit 4